MANWFYKQNKLLQIILLIIPFVGWIVELIVRWSSFLETKSLWNLVCALVFTFIGWAWILNVLDIIWLVLFDHLIGANA